MAVTPLSTATEGLLDGGSPLSIAVRGLLQISTGDIVLLTENGIQITPLNPEFSIPEVISNLGYSSIAISPEVLQVFVGDSASIPAPTISISPNTLEVSYTSFRFVNINSGRTISIWPRPIEATIYPQNHQLSSLPFNNIGIANWSLTAYTPNIASLPATAIGLATYTFKVHVDEISDLPESTLQILAQVIQTFTGDFSSISSQTIELTEQEIQTTLGDISNLGPLTITIEPQDPLVLVPNISDLANTYLDLDPQLPAGLTGEMSILAVPNINLSTKDVTAYTLGIGQSVWRETYSYTLYMGRKMRYTIDR